MKIVRVTDTDKDRTFEVCPTSTCPVSHTVADHLVYNFGKLKRGDHDGDSVMTEDQMIEQVKLYARRDTQTETPPEQTTRSVSIKV